MDNLGTPKESRSNVPSNALPELLDDLFPFSEQVIHGLALRAQNLGLHIQAAVLEEALKNCRTKQQEYQAVLGEGTRALRPASKEAAGEMRKFFLAAKKVLRHHLGEQWNQAYSEAGFVNHTIATPSTQSRRYDLLQDLATYFTKHSDFEAANFGVTAARAGELLSALRSSREAVARNQTRRKELKTSRAHAEKKLRMRLATVIRELHAVLETDSPFWSDFGLHSPAELRKRRTKPASDTSAGEETASHSPGELRPLKTPAFAVESGRQAA